MPDCDIDEKTESKMEARSIRRQARRGIFDFGGDKVANEALDRPALMAIDAMIRSGAISGVNGTVSAGKESVVFWAQDASGADVALKVYLVSTASFRQREKYIAGDPRFGRIKKGTRAMVGVWAQKEFANLSLCTRHGLPVPRPIRVIKNVLAMGFVGEAGSRARTLQESEAKRPEYEQAVAILRDMYCQAGLVHGDYSGYNIFKTGGGLVAFDLGSAVDKRHPMALEFLKRDINNITNLFARRGLVVENPSDVLEAIVQ